MFHPKTQKVQVADSAHTVPSSQQSHSPPLHSGLLTTTDRLYILIDTPRPSFSGAVP